ncbi:hypothetical protein V8G69_16165 [Gaetbulibacter sp. M235]|uniref:carboxypeptidase-like regulatory domain-containing protein n=1 Tax=Gaetbulibacter sp. M235 TaxID=3126510 RepID=UPI00374F29CC
MKKISNISKKLIKLTLILVCGISFGQSKIVGKIKSDITNDKPYGNIYLEINNGNKSQVDRMTIADSIGIFQFNNLEPNKTYKIKVQLMGYEDQEFEVKTNENIQNVDLTLKGICGFVSLETAEKDWKKNKAKLYLVGGIAPVGNRKEDYRFEKKYKIKYYDFGDTAPNMECIQIYNERIFELMDEKYGTEWRKKVRSDVEYLK